MLTMTLLAKIYSKNQLGIAEKTIMSKLTGLKVQTKINNVTERGWIQISISGEDENVAKHFLTNEIGLCPESIDKIEKNLVITGRVANLNKSKDRLFVDIGISTPAIADVTVSLSDLQAHLVDGRKVAFRAIVELFNLCENLPMTVQVVKTDIENQFIEGILADRQLLQYRTWVGSLLDRLIILGASSEEVEYAVKMSGLTRDVVKTEPLGLFEHSVESKLGTDAAGLIPLLGRRLKTATFSIFSPRKIMKLVDS